MNTKDFIRLGIPLGEATRRATDFVSKFILSGGDKTRLEQEVKAIVANPSAFTEDSLRGDFAKALLSAPPPPRREPIKYRQWGEGLEHEAVMQMERACLLPVAVAGGADAGRACGLRTAHRRSPGNGEYGDSLCGRRGHRLPHEDDGARHSIARIWSGTRIGSRVRLRPRRGLAWVPISRTGVSTRCWTRTGVSAR